jgi:hypothetical protein
MKSIFIKYLLLCASLLLFSEVTKCVLHFDKLLYNSLAEKLTDEQIQNFLSLQNEWHWLEYVFIPLYILLKSSFIAIVLYIGTFFFSKTEITLKKIWICVIKAEFIFLLVPILKIIWFHFIQTNYTLEDLQYFYPLSALNIVGYKGLEVWFIYPLQVLNLFELAYWLLLSYFVGKLAFTEKDKGKPMDLGFKIVASSYGSALLLWVVVVMFFTLNYS